MKIEEAELQRRLSELKGREFHVSGDINGEPDALAATSTISAIVAALSMPGFQAAVGGYQSDEFILNRGVVLAHVKHKQTSQEKFSRIISDCFVLTIAPNVWWNSKPRFSCPCRLIDGEIDDYIVIRVCDRDKTSDLWPGEHTLGVKAVGRWSVHLIQPDLGQVSESIVSDEIEKPFDEFIGEGHYVLPPMITGNKPVIAKAQHKGRAGFLVYATSVDGTHEVAIFRREGQFFEEGSSTDLIPGKEYILEIFADGEWNVSCSEGY